AAGFAGVDRELEQAAALDGATSLQVFRYVTVPLAWTALFGGAVMTWALALGQITAVRTDPSQHQTSRRQQH
ncbi:MAG: ABC transporter permease subunit, partial [Chlorobia bacterium]|nr:ABC transporter permease subunit [Fimbriimonadaceae bacterium]